MAIDRITAEFKPIEFISKPTPVEGVPNAKAQEASGSKFGEVLTNAMGEVNGLQVQADQKIEAMMTGKGGVSTHEAMIALEKADVAFELMNQLRTKIIRAYEEVMRTQV